MEANGAPSATERRRKWKNKSSGGGVSGGVYFMAFIGALVYFIEHADSFWGGVVGFLKAIIWPAILVYKALEYFGM